MKKLLLTLTLAAASAAALPAANPTIYGVYGYMNGFSKTTGVYKFQAEEPTASETLYTYTGMNPYECGSVILEDRIVYIEPFTSYSKPALKVTRFTDIDDPSTYTRDSWVDNLPNTSANTALCVDPISKRIYGFFFNEDKTTYFLGTLDPETGLSTKIKDIDLKSRPITIAINNYGVVYAITQQGKLFKGSYEGDFDEVGELNVKTSSSSTRCGAAVFDPVDDTFYWVIYDNNYDYSFCVIDPATAHVTKTVQGLGSASALYIPAMAPDDAAPARIEDLSVTADGFNTEITVSFTAPNTTVGGASISGALNAYIAVDGNIKIDGDMVGPGTVVSKDIDVSDGPHTIVAWVTTRGNEPLASEKAPYIFFAGQDKPEAVGDLTVSQAADHKSVTLNWTAPEKGAGGGNFDTETLTYTVSILPNDRGEEGEVLESGLKDCTYTYALTDQELRFLQFEVVPATNSVTGIAATTETIAVGEDFPGKVGDLTASQEDEGIVLNWTAPTEGKNGSYFDNASLIYNVILLPEEVVASGLTETTYTYTVDSDDMLRLQFEVRAVTDKGEGEGVQSDAFVVGAAHAVPYREDFETVTSTANFDEIFYTVINANDDAKLWQPYTYQQNRVARITYTSSNGVYQDDWLITAPIKFEGGRLYKLSFDALLDYPSWGTENLEVFVGSAPAVDAMTLKVGEYEYSTSKSTSEGRFGVPEDGVYYVGFHCVSPGNHGDLLLDNIAIDAAPPATAGNLVPQEITLDYMAGDTDPVTATIPVSLEELDGELLYMGYQFELTLPEWLTVTGAAVGEGLAGEVKYNFLNEDEADRSENIYRFISVLNTNNSAGYTATEGIARINVSADRSSEAYVPGTYQAIASEVVFSSVTGSDINFINGTAGDIIVNDVTNYIAVIGTPTATLEEPSYDNSGKPLTAITTGEGLAIDVPVTFENASSQYDEELTWSVTADGNEIDGSCLTYDTEVDAETGATVYTFSFDSSDIEGNVEITFSALKAAPATYSIDVVAVLLGDSNFNGDVTVADVVTTANFIVDLEDTRFDYPNANIILDDEDETPSRDGITVQDVNATVDIVLGLRDAQGNPMAVRRHASVMVSGDALVVDGFKVNRNDIFTIPVNLQNTNAYASIQATIEVPEGMEVKNVTLGERASRHDLAFNIKENGEVKVVVYSVNNRAFADGEGAIFNLEVIATEECGDIAIENIKAADARCNGYILGFNGGQNATGTTGIDGIDAEEQGVRYFTVDGIEVFNPEKGQILIRVKDGEATKVVY